MGQQYDIQDSRHAIWGSSMTYRTVDMLQYMGQQYDTQGSRHAIWGSSMTHRAVDMLYGAAV